MSRKNMIQLYFQNEKKVPFVVRDIGWTGLYGHCVLRVRPRKTPNGWFGRVYGITLVNPESSRPEYYPAGVYELNCSGNYKWEIIPEDLWLPGWKEQIEEGMKQLEQSVR